MQANGRQGQGDRRGPRGGGGNTGATPMGRQQQSNGQYQGLMGQAMENQNHKGKSNQHNQQTSPTYHAVGDDAFLVDYPDIPFEVANYGNIVSFVTSTTPKVVPFGAVQMLAGGQSVFEPQFHLSDVWKSLNVPFGVSIELENASFNPHKAPDRAAYYTPLLSAISFTYASHYSRQRQNAAQGDTTSDDGVPMKDTADDSKEEKGPLDDIGMYWSTDAKPENRLPLWVQMERLASERFPGLLECRNTDFTHTSWFAVMWQPIFSHNHTPTKPAGQFLAFYLIRPPLKSNYQQGTAVFKCDLSTSMDRMLWAPVDEAEQRRRSHSSEQEMELGEGTVASKEGSVADSVGQPSSQPSNKLGSPATVSAGCNLIPEDAMSRGSSSDQYVVCTPLCGLVPVRVRNDIWFQIHESNGAYMYVTPLFLVASAAHMMLMQERRYPIQWEASQVNDYYRSLRHEKVLSDVALQVDIEWENHVS